MDLRQVVFLGGNGRRLASVQIRCLDIAGQLGCDYRVGDKFARQIPDKYSAFICVKPDFGLQELVELRRRGKVIWDIIDTLPPEQDVDLYLASTRTSRHLFNAYGRIVLIPHHHCNDSMAPNPSDLRRPAWIGARHWLPPLQGFEYDTYFADRWRRLQVMHAHRKIGIGLNFRSSRPANYPVGQQKLGHEFHVAINSGIKLINCLGYGTPSISANEPAYHEIGLDCTILSSVKKCAGWVRALQHDDALYLDLRKKCLRKAPRFHVSAIAKKYRKLLESL